ncbi:MAG: hypothetical protein ACLFTZ_00960 [Acholeplasmataceae bacterium]
MAINLSIGPLELDYGIIASFLLGISFGFVIVIMIYIYAVIRSMNKKLKRRKADEVDIDEQEIKWLIDDAKAQFKDKERRNEVGFIQHLGNVAGELSSDIARKFYPESKYPYFELTIDETLHMSHYITDRIDELLSSKILKLFRGTTLRRIIELNETKENIENSPIVRTAKKYRLSEVAKTTAAVLNATNPFYWGRKGVSKLTTHAILMKIGLAVIAITGEETYKIYSKKVFDEERTIDNGLDEIYDAISKSESKDDLP